MKSGYGPSMLERLHSDNMMQAADGTLIITDPVSFSK
jgi:hypothetical protein